MGHVYCFRLNPRPPPPTPWMISEWENRIGLGSTEYDGGSSERFHPGTDIIDSRNLPYRSLLPGFHYMSPEEALAYHQQVVSSEGFDVPDLHDVGDLDLIRRVPLPVFSLGETLAHSVEISIKAYHDQQNEKLELVGIMKVNRKGFSPIDLYITFKGKDSTGNVNAYQALVRVPYEIEQSTVILVRREPGGGQSDSIQPNQLCASSMPSLPSNPDRDPSADQLPYKLCSCHPGTNLVDFRNYPEAKVLPPGKHFMGPEEALAFYQHVVRSEGFDVPDLPDVADFFLIQPVCPESLGPWLSHGIKIAMGAYRDEKKEELELVRVVKVNEKAASPTNLYITFEAKDSTGEVKTYQALVCIVIPHEKASYVKFVRLKPPVEDGEAKEKIRSRC